jgi:hypothetical protein
MFLQSVKCCLLKTIKNTSFCHQCFLRNTVLCLPLLLYCGAVSAPPPAGFTDPAYVSQSDRCFFGQLLTRLQSATVNKKVLISNWFFFGLNDLFGITAKWIDKLFLVYLLTPAEFAVFFNGSIEIPLFALLISVVGHVLLVEIAPRLHKKAEVVALFRNSFFLLAGIVFPLFFFFYCYSHELFSLLFSNKYNNAVAIFKISVLIIPLRITNYTALLQCYGKGKTSSRVQFLILPFRSCLCSSFSTPRHNRYCTGGGSGYLHAIAILPVAFSQSGWHSFTESCSVWPPGGMVPDQRDSFCFDGAAFTCICRHHAPVGGLFNYCFTCFTEFLLLPKCAEAAFSRLLFRKV